MCGFFIRQVNDFNEKSHVENNLLLENRYDSTINPSLMNIHMFKTLWNIDR